MKRVIARKYKRCSESCYIRCGNSFKKVDGKPIKFEEFDNFDFFISKKIKGKLVLWMVTEAVTGTRLTPYYTKLSKTLKSANDILKSKSKLDIVKAIHKRVGEIYLPPNFKFVQNPNKVKYVASKVNKDDSLDDALRNRVRVLKK
jgi:hypothetical protein